MTWAISAGRHETLRLLLAHGAMAWSSGGVAKAIEMRDFEALAILVAAGAHLNKFDDEETHVTPLASAVQTGDVELARRLLEVGADPNFLDVFRMCALEHALVEGKGEIADLLMPVTRPALRRNAVARGKKAAEARAHDELVLAVRANDAGLVREKLGAGLSPDRVGASTHDCATTVAARLTDPAMLRLLLDAGASPDGSKDSRPLRAAAFSGRVQALTLLLDRGATVDLSDDDDRGPAVFAAAQQGEIECFQILVDRGANVRGYWGPQILQECETGQRREVLRDRWPAYREIEKMVDRALRGG